MIDYSLPLSIWEPNGPCPDKYFKLLDLEIVTVHY